MTQTDAAFQQVIDFADEARALHQLVGGLSVAELTAPTAFKGWTGEDIIRHLHFWNGAADLSVTDPDALPAIMSDMAAAGSMWQLEQAAVPQTGADLIGVWMARVETMAERWARLDPKTRLPWVGPTMSARSSMTARQMEHWAHGQALYDLMGVERGDTDRLKNIVVLGVNTYSWTFQVRGQSAPGPMPRLNLTAPSGGVWTFGETGADRIAGNATEFCQVVTQTRNIKDTALAVEGPVAEAWMKNAQCFAGGPETPPAPGVRGLGKTG
ncbi:MAG: TIGR03084 family metal-binding protein [Pseudomonadota bacterium]